MAWQVRGDFDDPLYLPGIVESLPESKVVSVGSFKLGVCHGHQIVPWGDAESLGAPHPPPRPERGYRMTTSCRPALTASRCVVAPAARAGAMQPHTDTRRHTQPYTHTHTHTHTHTTCACTCCVHVHVCVYAGAMQRQLDCDIFVSGHTHRFSAYESGAASATHPPTHPPTTAHPPTHPSALHQSQSQP